MVFHRFLGHRAWSGHQATLRTALTGYDGLAGLPRDGPAGYAKGWATRSVDPPPPDKAERPIGRFLLLAPDWTVCTPSGQQG
jgi:hypothetical protein